MSDKAVGIVGAVTAATVMIAGCSLPNTDKAGSDTIVLKLATIDGQVNSNGYGNAADTFVRALSEVSGDRIQVDVETTYGGEGVSSESKLVEAIAEGDIDGGWPSTRAFAGAGIPGLAAIEAPLTITSYAAEKELAEGDAARLVMSSLEGSGVRGLGLAVGPLRRPFGVREFLLYAREWEGMRFSAHNSPVQTATIAALGGTAVQTSTDWTALDEAGELDGIEFDVAQYLANGYGPQAGKVVSNVVLWPEMFVLTLNHNLWDSLSAQQRGWVQTAADQAVQASVDADYPDEEIAWKLCARGVRFKPADPGQILTIHEAVEPVIDDLAEDSEEAQLLREVQAVADRHPNQDTITVQDSCATEANLPNASNIPTTLAPIPDGTYRKQISEADVAAAGLSNNDGTSGTWTLKVANGHWYVSCRPLSTPGVDCGHSIDDEVLDAGSFYGDDEVVWMLTEPALVAKVTGCQLPADGSEGHCHSGPPPAQLEWSLDGDDLVFSSSSSSLGFETILKTYVRIQ